ncbi:hypothetical protein B9Z19DRAFT_282805 [Tuber borchii]|uniref:Uncharacterized protein n=1 Tax=Tuber borchii TaxID=42251 RepID=A0A2T7A5B7_TUBBO|nr:hypothetical protein B9Z19DRAFT_282805 [Tuber borchii]
MAMNWTGGTRNRATKISSTSRLQKRYFAKVRAAAQTFTIPSSQGNHPPNVFKRRRQTTPEFDIVVKKARSDHGEAIREAASPLLHIDKDSGKAGREVEEDIRKARRRMLLEREDWVCTTLSKPLVLKSKEEMRKLKANFHWEIIETSSSGATSSEDESDDDDGSGDSGILRNCSERGAASVPHESGRGIVPREGAPELPECPGDGEDIYIRIGGSTQRSATSAIDSTRTTESASRSTEINPTAIRGSSADTMLLDFDKHKPMFQFQHITPRVSDMVERKRREVRQSGYSSSPLARYSRQRGNRVPIPLDEGSGEVGEDDRLIQEVEQVSSPIPSSSTYSTIILQTGPGARERESLYPGTGETIEYDFPRIASMGGPVDEKISKEETLGHTRVTSVTFGPSQVSWSTSPAERRPCSYQREQSFDEIASEVIASENLLNLKPFVCSANGTQTRVEVTPDTDRDMHEVDEEDEEGTLDNNRTREIAEPKVEESETEMDQDDDSPGSNQNSSDPMSRDSNEDNMKDNQESTDYEWDEEDTTATHGATEEILGTIHVASTVAPEGTWAEIIGLITDGPTPPAQEDPIVAQDDPNQVEPSQTGHNLAECNNTQDSLGSAVDDQVFTHLEWLDKVLATSSDLFKSPEIHSTEHREYENREASADPVPNPPEPKTSKPPHPTPTKKKHGKYKRPARRFLIPPDEESEDNLRRVAPFRERERGHEIHCRQQQQQQQRKGLPHLSPENITSPIASPVALVYSKPYGLGFGLRERSVSAGDGAGEIRRNVGGKREGGGRGLVWEGEGGGVEDFEDF